LPAQVNPPAPETVVPAPADAASFAPEAIEPAPVDSPAFSPETIELAPANAIAFETEEHEEKVGVGVIGVAFKPASGSHAYTVLAPTMPLLVLPPILDCCVLAAGCRFMDQYDHPLEEQLCGLCEHSETDDPRRVPGALHGPADGCENGLCGWVLDASTGIHTCPTCSSYDA